MQGREGRKHLYHMAPKVLWGELKGKRQPYFPPTYEQVGTALRLLSGLLSTVHEFRKSVLWFTARAEQGGQPGERLKQKLGAAGWFHTPH